MARNCGIASYIPTIIEGWGGLKASSGNIEGWGGD
jgi:hypothetical protein